ncbi:Initiation factor [Asimina triloba]
MATVGGGAFLKPSSFFPTSNVLNQWGWEFRPLVDIAELGFGFGRNPEMAEEVTETTAVEIGGGEQKQPHHLERKWTFWFDNQSKSKQGAAWGTTLRKVYTFDTVEQFWWCNCVGLVWSRGARLLNVRSSIYPIEDLENVAAELKIKVGGTELLVNDVFSGVVHKKLSILNKIEVYYVRGA